MEQKNFWCIVTYIGATPFYYAGYYGKNAGEVELKPALSIDFNEALKCHSKGEAERIFHKLNISDWKVEEHAYM